MTKKKATKKTVPRKALEDSFKSLQEEGQELIERRNKIMEEKSLIEIRLQEIQGGINVLIPLLKN
jgi:hypothetical protein